MGVVPFLFYCRLPRGFLWDLFLRLDYAGFDLLTYMVPLDLQSKDFGWLEVKDWQCFMNFTKCG